MVSDPPPPPPHPGLPWLLVIDCKATIDGKFFETGVLERGRTWNTCAESNKGDGSDAVLEVDGAAEVGCEVADDGRETGDDHDRGDEAPPASEVVGRRHEGKEDLPEDGQEVHDVVTTRWKLLLSLLVIVSWQRSKVNGFKNVQDQFISNASEV